MRIDNIEKLIEFLSKNQNVCILDNNSIEFLLKVKDDISIEEIFKPYDLVLLPGWVEIEVNDSIYRSNYINKLSLVPDILFYNINEIKYIDLLQGRDGFLFNIFAAICKFDAKLFSFIHRSILQGKSIEDLPDYEEWLGVLYNNGFENSKIIDGRIRKKNAGEISIGVLAFIIAGFFEVSCVTVISQDGGTYEMIKRAQQNLISQIKFKYDNPITFKSNDCIIHQFYKLGNLKERVNYKMLKLRNPRNLRYTRLKADKSIEERYKVVDNDEFLELLQDDTLQIIF